MEPKKPWEQLLSPPFIVTLFMMSLAAYATIIVLTGNFSVELKAAVVTAVIISNRAEIAKFWMNSTSDSEKKNETISALVKKEGSNV